MATQKTADALEFHTQIAGAFDQTYSYDSNRLERLHVWDRCLAKYLNDVNLAYDLGCGSGAITTVLATYAKRIIAVDGAEGMLEVARENASRRGLGDRIEFLQRRLPMPNRGDLPPANAVISSSAIEYMDSLPEALGFVHDLLTEQGIFIFSMSNRDSISRKIVRGVHALSGRPQYIKYLKHFVKVEELNPLLTSAGFVPLEFTYFGGADRLNRFLKLFFSPRHSSNMILVVARRSGNNS